MAPTTIEVTVDLGPERLAAMFCEMDSEQQANFFRTVCRTMAGWKDMAGGMQLCYIGEELRGTDDEDVREWVDDLLYHSSKDARRSAQIAGGVVFKEECGPVFGTNPCAEFPIGRIVDIYPEVVIEVGLNFEQPRPKSEPIPGSEPCPDCKGTGIYEGFTQVEDCRTCGGSGQR